MTITPAQCRAARALLDWTQDDLAARSKVSKRTILHFEKASGRKPIPANMDAIQRALEAAGVTFIDGDQPGVRLTLK
jgi:transcriptional regulator with XRE-family HTH domain